MTRLRQPGLTAAYTSGGDSTALTGTASPGGATAAAGSAAYTLMVMLGAAQVEVNAPSLGWAQSKLMRVMRA